MSASGSGSAGDAAMKDAPPAGAFARRFPRVTSTFQRYSATRAARVTMFAWRKRRPIFFGLAITYGAVNYAVLWREAALKDEIHPDTWLTLKVHPGSIVDCRSGPSITAYLTSPSVGEDRPSVMELFEVCRAIKSASKDPRIRGIFADFSGLHIPSSVTPMNLGMAQVEELVECMHEFRRSKTEQFYVEQATGKEGLQAISDMGERERPTESDVQAIVKEFKEKLEKAQKEGPAPPVTTIAWADTFDSQGSYLLASAFDRVYLQPSGEVPLTGVTMQIPFVKKALDWLGVKVYAEARKEFKSMIATYTQDEGLTSPQLQNTAKLLGELGRNLAYAIGVNRFPDMAGDEAADHVMQLCKQGPFPAKDALQKGLISGIRYKSEVVKELGEDPKARTLSSYLRIQNQALDNTLSEDERINVAVVYLQGTISNAPGEFSTSAVIKGLKEASEDDDVSAIVLRIDSGGGDVVASDSIWDAVRRVQEDSKKPVVASFGNISASGGYYASAGADAILACESTVTGSIGVASLRPNATRKIFDRLGVQLQTIFTGSLSNSVIHSMEPEEQAKHSRHIDETYDTFLEKVCDGRKISRDVVGELAGGRVWTGLAALTRYGPGRDDEGEKVVVDDAPSEKQPRGDGEEAAANIAPAGFSHDQLDIEWNTNDVTGEGEMSTIQIQVMPMASHPGGKNDTEAEADNGEEALQKAIHAEFADTDKGNESRSEARREIVARSAVEGDPDMSEEDAAFWAAMAHEEAEASHAKPAPASQPRPAKKELGPYGKGLIDGIGGIYDATYLAMTFSLQRKIDKFVQDGMTLEQAQESLLPDCPREVDQDGVVSVAADVRLVRYPKEKNWRERLRETIRTGDKPSLSILPGFGNVGLQLREILTDAAVQVLMKCWQDPAMVQRMIGEVEREKRIKLEYESHMRM